jgi:hypothetical protein
MLTFFHGWRRKIGCVTLVMALALMVVWMRGQVRFDFLELNLSHATYRICTLGGSVRFLRQTPSDGGQLLAWRSGDLTEIFGYGTDENGKPEHYDEWEDAEVEWRRDFLGIHAGAGQYSSRRVVCCVLPYWSLVLPVTLLSGYLIVFKPRKPAHISPD